MLAIYGQVQLSPHQLSCNFQIQLLKDKMPTIKSEFENNVIVDTNRYLAN